MKAIIMAGGEGTRLRPLTCTVPKPMLPIANRPVIDYAVELLKKHGIREIGVTLRYLPEMISSHLEASERECGFEFFTETDPLGTAGSIKAAEDFLSDTFVVLSGDGLTDIDLSEVIRFHKEKHADATLVLKKTEDPTEYGIVTADSSGKIVRFSEKPSWEDVFSNTVNTGIYVLNKSVLSLIETGEEADFSKDIFPKMLDKGMNLFGFTAGSQTYWCDIGDPFSYIKANSDVIEGKVNVRPFSELGYYEIKKGVFVGKYARLDEDAVLEAPCLIGAETTVCKNTVIHSGTVIGSHSYIGRNSTIKASVIGDNVYIGNSCQIRKAVICKGTGFGDSVNVFEGSIIADNCALEDNITVSGKAMIWPEKKIESSSFVTENVIWQTVRHHGLFSEERISGRINSELSVQSASLAASAFVGLRGKRIVSASNGTPLSDMLYRAVTSGLICGGAKVLELKSASLPAARYAVRLLGADGGIYVGENNGTGDIFFLDEKGANISSAEEKKIEAALSGKAVCKKPPEQYQLPQNFEKCCDMYRNHIINTVKEKGKFPDNIKIKLVSTHVIESDILASILIDLNANLIVADSPDRINEPADITVQPELYGEKLCISGPDGQKPDRFVLSLLINYISVKEQSGEKFIISDYSVPEAAEEIARTANGTVIRTKSGTRALINEIIKHEGIADSIPVGKLSMYYDGAMFLCELVRFMSAENKTFPELISSMPKIHLSEKEAPCPWNLRAEVISKLSGCAEKSTAGSGLRIKHKYGWSLILPDTKRAVFKIYSEGFSEEYSKDLTDICIRRINEATNGKKDM